MFVCNDYANEFLLYIPDNLDRVTNKCIINKLFGFMVF